MKTIKIPVGARKTLHALVRMDEEHFAELAAAISSTAPFLSRSRFSADVAKSAKAVDEELVRSIVNEFFNIESLREAGEQDSELKVADLISTSIRGASQDAPQFDDSEAQVLKTRIQKVLSGRKSLSLTAKSSNVITDQDRVFIKARILTDFRPVFNEVATAIDAGVVVHTLTIHFAQDSMHKDFYVALDCNDVRTLRAQLDRADKKASLLHDLITKAGVVELTPEDES